METYSEETKKAVAAEQAKKTIKAQKAANTKEINILTAEIADLRASILKGSKYRHGEPIHLVHMSYQMDLACAKQLRTQLNK